MVYGSADLHDIPWEIIVKEFRRHSANSHFDHLQQYADSFIEWIAGNNKIFPPAARTKILLDQASLSHFVTIYQHLQREDYKEAGTSEEKAVILAPLLEAELERLAQTFTKTLVTRFGRA